MQLLTGEDFKDELSKEQIQQVIKEVDTNGDGEVDFEEFIIMMRSLVAQRWEESQVGRGRSKWSTDDRIERQGLETSTKSWEHSGW